MNRLRTSDGRRRVNTRKKQQKHVLNVKARARKMSPERLRRIFICIFFIVTGIGLVGGATYGIRRGLDHFFWTNPNYRLTEVNFQSDGPLTKAEALKISGIEFGKNIFSVDLASMREKLAGLPRVLHVEMERDLPSAIKIRVNERKPLAWIAQENAEPASKNSFLIDANGVLFRHSEMLPDHLKLPTIHGLAEVEMQEGQSLNTAEVRAALQLVQLSDTAEQLEVRSIDLSKGYCMKVTTGNRALITFGLDRVEEQLERLVKCLNYCEENKRELQTVNLLVHRNVPVTFMPADEPGVNGSPAKKTVKPGKPDPVEPKKPARKEAVEPVIRKAIPLDPKGKLKNG